MRQKFELGCPTGDVEDLLRGKTGITVFLNKLFENKAYHKTLCNALAAYHNDEGGSPEVHGYEMIDAGFDSGKLSGWFYCKFKVHFTYGCSGIENDQTDKIKWDFDIGESLNLIHFTGEEPWIREPEGY